MSNRIEPLELRWVCFLSFFLDEKRNKKIKTAQNFGNNYGSLRYVLDYLALRE